MASTSEYWRVCGPKSPEGTRKRFRGVLPYYALKHPYYISTGDMG